MDLNIPKSERRFAIHPPLSALNTPRTSSTKREQSHKLLTPLERSHTDEDIHSLTLPTISRVNSTSSLAFVQNSDGAKIQPIESPCENKAPEQSCHKFSFEKTGTVLRRRRTATTSQCSVSGMKWDSESLTDCSTDIEWARMPQTKRILHMNFTKQQNNMSSPGNFQEPKKCCPSVSDSITLTISKDVKSHRKNGIRAKSEIFDSRTFNEKSEQIMRDLECKSKQKCHSISSMDSDPILNSCNMTNYRMHKRTMSHESPMRIVINGNANINGSCSYGDNSHLYQNRSSCNAQSNICK